MKFLLWGLIVAAVVLWVLRTKKTRANTPRTRRDGADQDSAPTTEQMVCCAHCGVHLPLSESVPGAAGTVYCSDEHRRLAGGA